MPRRFIRLRLGMQRLGEEGLTCCREQDVRQMATLTSSTVEALAGRCCKMWVGVCALGPRRCVPLLPRADAAAGCQLCVAVYALSLCAGAAAKVRSRLLLRPCALWSLGSAEECRCQIHAVCALDQLLVLEFAAEGFSRQIQMSMAVRLWAAMSAAARRPTSAMCALVLGRAPLRGAAAVCCLSVCVFGVELGCSHLAGCALVLL